MKLWSLMSSIAVALLQWTVPHGAAAQSLDEAAIREVQVQQAEAWNRHDAHAYAALFSDDGDVVNVVGWWWKGRPEIERKLTDAFAVMFRESRFSLGEYRSGC